jgi:hypothetical protein
MIPNPRDKYKRDGSMKKTIYCREKDCKFLIKLLLIGKIVRIKDKHIKMHKNFSYWLMELRKSQCGHQTLRNKNLLQIGLRYVECMEYNHNEIRFNALLTPP